MRTFKYSVNVRRLRRAERVAWGRADYAFDKYMMGRTNAGAATRSRNAAEARSLDFETDAEVLALIYNPLSPDALRRDIDADSAALTSHEKEG